jgi:hypothetical protein
MFFAFLWPNLVLARHFTALFDQSEYRVFHAGIMDSQVVAYKVCCCCN